MSIAVLCAAALLLWPAPPRLRGVRRTGSLRRQLRRLLRPGPWAVGPVAALLGALVSTPLVAVLAGCGAALGARAWHRRRRDAGEQARLLALTETLGSISAELRAGRSLATASRTAIEECADPDVARTLARALAGPAAAEPGAGAVGAALRRVSAAAELSARTGCSLGGVLGAVEDDLRARHRQLLGLRSSTAGARSSAALLAGLPVLGLAMGSGIGADPWRVLTTTAAGQVLLVVGVALEAAGVAWVARLMRAAVP